MKPPKEMRGSVLISILAIMGAVAGTISFMKLEVPFPILVYLRIDLAEIPTVASFILFGPIAAVVTATIHWLVLNLYASFPIVGPLMKYLSVLSMLLGFGVGTVVFRKVFPKGGAKEAMGSIFLFGTIFRVILTAALNYVVIYVAFPDTFIPLAEGLLSGAGIALGSSLELMLWILGLTSIYNIVHMVVSLVPAYAVVPALAELLPGRINRSAWLYSFEADNKTSP